MLGYMLIYIREWIVANNRSPAKVLALLSRRYQEAATQLGLRHVPRVFDEHHGTISSMHYRTLAEVVQVITVDVIEPDTAMGRVITATVEWYWACRAPSFRPADITALQRKTEELRAAWEALDTPEWRATLRKPKKTKKGKKVSKFPSNPVLETPKFHRAVEHCVDYVREWGPLEFITTETSEAMHKPLKAYFRTYVLCVSECMYSLGCGVVGDVAHPCTAIRACFALIITQVKQTQCIQAHLSAADASAQVSRALG